MSRNNKFMTMISNLGPDDMKLVFGDSFPTIIKHHNQLFVGRHYFDTSLFGFKRSVKVYEEMAEEAGITYYNQCDIRRLWDTLSIVKPNHLNILMERDSDDKITKIVIDTKIFTRFTTEAKSRKASDMDTIIRYLYNNYWN